MAKQDRELLDRLRAAGLRKEIARPLSAVSADARKKSIKAARAAIQELRALADELERRLPTEPTPATAGQAASASAPRSRPRRTRPTPASARRPRTATRQRATAAAAPSKQAAGGNRAAIAEALRAGPMTASEIAAKTGISVGTVSTTLSRMANAGELAKAPRGYTLPS